MLKEPSKKILEIHTSFLAKILKERKWVIKLIRNETNLLAISCTILIWNALSLINTRLGVIHTLQS